MKVLLSRVHAKLGDLWWYTILLFVAQRIGDVINMFVGLWIVPHYVPMEELGAVLPLMNVVGVIGIPMAIVAIPFLKFVAVFAEKKEYGKVKAIIRDTFIGTGVFAVLSVAIASFVLPFFFERLRVANGSLAFLLVAGTVLGAVATIFSSAVFALRLFSVTVWFQAIAAPIRLVLMLVFMPFRPLSGYVVGQNALPLVNVFGSVFVLWKFLRNAIRPAPYWREYGRAIFHYTWPLAVMTVVSAITGNMDTLVIRHRLSEFESAGYYMITRFSDVSIMLGAAFTVFVLPMLAGKNGDDAESRKITFQSVLGTFVSGAPVVLLLLVLGKPLLELKSDWAPYASLANHMAALSVLGMLSLATSCLTGGFVARSRFAFLWWYLPIGFGKSVFLYALTGYTFFAGWVPDSWMSGIGTFNPCRLSVVIMVLLAAQALQFSIAAAQTFWPRASFGAFLAARGRTALDKIRKLRQSGWNGVKWYFRHMDRDFRIRSFLKANARRYPMTPVRGVTVIGDLESRGSLNKTMRDLVLSLREAGIPYQTFSTSESKTGDLSGLEGALTPIDDFRTLKYEAVLEMFGSPYPDGFPVRKFRVAFWEFESGFAEAYPDVMRRDCTVVGMSDFCVSCFGRMVPAGVRVRKLLYPLRIRRSPIGAGDVVRAKYRLGSGDFAVFFNFNFASGFARKNPSAAVEAFARAFGDVKSAKLVFKTQRAGEFPAEVERLRSHAERLGVLDRIVFIDDYMTTDEVSDLTSACDVYLSLHRGEGFGLGVAEAMLAGKPVVVSDCGATTEFCKEDCAALVPCRTVPFAWGGNRHPYFAVKDCPDPDVKAAASALRRLYEDEAFRMSLGERGRAFVSRHFSIERFRESVLSLLQA